MARDFDGVDDGISFGSDASIDNFTAHTFAFWIRSDTVEDSSQLPITKDDATNGWYVNFQSFDDPDRFTYSYPWSGAAAYWWATAPSPGVLTHVVVAYNGAATTNDPVIYYDGVSQTVTEPVAPSGTRTSDAGSNLRLGSRNDLSGDWNGVIGFFSYDNAIWDAAMVNRHRWWGTAPGGPSTIEVWQPLWTTDLNNKGTATANGTATGTTIINTAVPKVERMWGSMMGVGR